MEVQPATLAQVRAGRDGRRVIVEEDVGDIARQIHEIDHRLGVQWNEKGEFFMVIEQDGLRERLVLTAQELDGRVVERVRRIADPAYDFVGEIDQMDQQAQREKDSRFREETGLVGERLAHAVRKDLGYQGKVFVPDWMNHT